MKNAVSFLITFFLITIGSTGCHKGHRDDSILGTWKLVEISCSVGINANGYPELVDFGKYNLIFDFQKNNKLVISSSVSEESSIIKHSYKFFTKDLHEFPYYPRSYNLVIGKKKLDCYVFKETGVMVLSGYMKELYPAFMPQDLQQDSALSIKNLFIKIR